MLEDAGAGGEELLVAGVKERVEVLNVPI